MIKFPDMFDVPTVRVVRESRPQYNQVKVLLAAVIRRAAFDIALYKNDKRLVNRRTAVDAFKWMFDEREIMEMHPLDRFTSFQSICEVLDQDPNRIRTKTLALLPRDVRKFDLIRRV